MGDWSAILNGSALCGGETPQRSGFGLGPFGLTPFGLGGSSDAFDPDICDACLLAPPDGLGAPDLRTQDQTYPQRDGVAMFGDWYSGRIVTILGLVGGRGCSCSGGARAAAQRLIDAWSRQCGETELVLWPPCSGDSDTTTNGPYGIIGRPRVAALAWRKGRRDIADVTLRFDSIDHRIYILDADGTPGSGAKCASISAPGDDTAYRQEVADQGFSRYWPLIVGTLGDAPDEDGIYREVVDQIGGTDDSTLGAGYTPNLIGTPAMGPPILPTIGRTSIAGPATFEPSYAYPGGYTTGQFGWWQELPDDAASSVGTGFIIDTNYVGLNSLGNAPAAEIHWMGTSVAMNTAVSDAFGFTDGLRGEPVFIMLAWTLANLRIYVGLDDSIPPLLVQSVAAAGLPSSGISPILTTGAARFAGVMAGANLPTPSNDDVAEALRATAFDGTAAYSLTVPDYGNLCSPFTVTLADTDPENPNSQRVLIVRQDGSFVGLDDAATNIAPYSIDTATGTATRLSGAMDATSDILGDPFLQVLPGETVYVYATSGDIELCFRPSVLSA